MPKVREKLLDDVAEAMALVKSGKLFALQQWISDGKRLRVNDFSNEKLCLLFQACVCGFHSVVEVLLEATFWSQSEKDRAASRVVSDRRIDLVDLLLAHGADIKTIDFKDVCLTMDLGIMERFLRSGVDPAKENSFAQALDETAARPLLRLFKTFQNEFPALNGQAALALTEAIRGKRARWVALLAWAGADPLMVVPDDIYGGWDLEEGSGVTAAELACRSGDAILVKSLRLRPSREQAQVLLYNASWIPSKSVMEELLRIIPTNFLNAGERMSCRGVEAFIDRFYFYSFEQQDEAAAACLEMLLRAGGRWNPDPLEISRIRRTLCQHSPGYIVRAVRLLLNIRGAADLALVYDLCRTPMIRKKIALADEALYRKITGLKVRRQLPH